MYAVLPAGFAEGPDMNSGAWLTIALHTAGAAAFFFILQRFFMSATLESSLMWAVAGGAGAACLAWQQRSR